MPLDNPKPSKAKFDKSKLPSRHVTEGPERAPHRSYYYAMGMTEQEIHQPREQLGIRRRTRNNVRQSGQDFDPLIGLAVGPVSKLLGIEGLLVRRQRDIEQRIVI